MREYVDIGHGNTDSILWVHDGSSIRKISAQCGTHLSVWGDGVGRLWRGRYEPDTGRTSVAPPERLVGRMYATPSWLIDALEEAFGGSIEVWDFNPPRVVRSRHARIPRYPFNLDREQELDRYARNPPDDDADLLALIETYLSEHDLPAYVSTPYFEIDEREEASIARWYDLGANEPQSPRVRAAWHTLGQNTIAQYQFLQRHGYVFEEYGHEGASVDPNQSSAGPYADSTEMIADVRENRHLWAWAGGAPSELLPQAVNLAFRAVHDIFGHAAHGLSFGWRGEVNAWAQHWKMFLPPARYALTTETRAQVDWVFAGPYAREAQRGDYHFPEQKALILPMQFQTNAILEAAYG